MEASGKSASAGALRDVDLILGLEDPLEKGMATHSSILAWRIPWTEEPGQPTVHRVAQSLTRLRQLSTHSTQAGYPFLMTKILRVSSKFAVLIDHLRYHQSQSHLICLVLQSFTSFPSINLISSFMPRMMPCVCTN